MALASEPNFGEGEEVGLGTEVMGISKVTNVGPPPSKTLSYWTDAVTETMMFYKQPNVNICSDDNSAN